MKLIDKDIIVAELERRQKKNILNEGAFEEDIDILYFIKALKVKEVDLEKLGLQARIDKELVEEVYSHLDSIKDTADRMTSGNFMHNIAAIKCSVNTIVKVLELIGLKVQKGD